MKILKQPTIFKHILENKFFFLHYKIYKYCIKICHKIIFIHYLLFYYKY